MRSAKPSISEPVRLAVLPSDDGAAESRVDTRPPRHPSWLKVRMPSGETYFEVRRLVREQKLNTVCESASCPNIGECWSERSLTIMILGNICTRSCQFCDVPTGRPLPPDPDEPRRVADTLSSLGLRHTVITCVDRDDLDDGGAGHWAATIDACRKTCPQMTLEVLTGDFQGDTNLVDIVLDARPDVFAHNLETVPRLSRQVRVQARYERSYAVLAHAKKRGAVVKSGLMMGLGESLDEVREVIDALGQMKLDILTLGQYLRPSKAHLPLARYVAPEEFDSLKQYALDAGITHVEAGPLVRSSYHASGQAELVGRIKAARQREGVTTEDHGA